MRRSSTPHLADAARLALSGGHVLRAAGPAALPRLHGLPVLPVDLSQLHQLERGDGGQGVGRARQLPRADPRPDALAATQPDLGHRRHGGADRHWHGAGDAAGGGRRDSPSFAPSTSCPRCSPPWSSASSGTGSTTPSSASSTRARRGRAGGVSRGWLGDPDVALYAVLIAAIWATIGYLRHLPGRFAEREQGSPGSGHRRWGERLAAFLECDGAADGERDQRRRRAPAHRRLQRLRHHLRHDRRRPANATRSSPPTPTKRRSPRTTSAMPPPSRW